MAKKKGKSRYNQRHYQIGQNGNDGLHYPERRVRKSNPNTGERKDYRHVRSKAHALDTKYNRAKDQDWLDELEEYDL